MYVYITRDARPGESIQMAVNKTTRTSGQKVAGRLNKHQERTEATLGKLLHSAETVFTRDGFASARLEQIAEHAGYTRGAIYAHYRSKEDLFLALLEQRMNAKVAELGQMLEEPASRAVRLRRFRAMLLQLAEDRSWSILSLEFKLFALRQPKLKSRIRRIQASLKAPSRAEYVRSLFGEVSPENEHAITRRFALLGAIISAAVLESHFRPEVLGGDGLEAVLAELFEAVVRK
jgi:AcrR family transcriptional regulator